MTWIEMPFLSTSLYDVTEPSQFPSTIVRQRTTTALGYEAPSTSLSPVQALPSSTEALYVEESGKVKSRSSGAPVLA
jgi:hypothetical protein